MSKEAVNAIKEANLDHLDISSYKQTFMEGFILFNFSESQIPYSEADCKWFYELSIKQSCFSVGEATEFWSNCARFGVFHLILTRILGFPKRPSKTEDQTKPTQICGILNIFDEKVYKLEHIKVRTIHKFCISETCQSWGGAFVWKKI